MGVSEKRTSFLSLLQKLVIRREDGKNFICLNVINSETANQIFIQYDIFKLYSMETLRPTGILNPALCLCDLHGRPAFHEQDTET
jgi:hypothetical protein